MLKEVKKVRILTDAPLQFYGGGEKVILDLANYLIFRGIQVDIVQSGEPIFSRLSLEEVRKMTSADIIVTNSPKQYRPKFLYQNLPDFDNFMRDRVNLMFLYRVPPKRFLSKLQKLNYRVIFCIHGITTVINTRSIKLKFFKVYTKFALKYFAKFLQEKSNLIAQVLSKSTENFLKLNGADGTHLKRIPNGIDFNKYSVGRNDEEFTIIFIGRIQDDQKGIDRLVRVINQLPRDIRKVVIGSGPDSEILRSIPDGKLDYLGFVSETEKIERLKTSNLIILTSNMEPFGLVLLEGLASGLPFVSTPVEGPIELLTFNAGLGTVSSFDYKKLSRDILIYYNEWIKDKELYYVTKLSRREEAKQIFNLQIMMEQYYQMIANDV